MSNVIKDISTITTISEKTLNKLKDRVILSICENVTEDKMEDKTLSEIDLGIGVLYIGYADTSAVKYKFIPSEELQKNVRETLNGKLNLMNDTLNAALSQAFENIYKDLC